MKLTNENLRAFGLKEEEISVMTPEQVVCYIRFHHEKKYGTSSILFIGFSDEDFKLLANKAKAAGLSVNSKISSNLTFACGSESADEKRIIKAQEYGAQILSKNEFEILFSDIEYNLRNCTLIYDISVPVELRIAKPLSNFDRTLEVASFSFESKEKYLVNLYTSTCSCKDFSQQNRSQYVQGDIRRFCKHLMQEYKSNFGLSAATDFQKFIIENSQTLYTQVEYLKLDELTTPVIVNYRFKDEWWNIFIQNEKGAYKSYGYSPMDGRFSYGETPRGLTAPLRQKLEKLRSQLGGTSNSQPITKKRDNSHQKKSIQSNKAKPTEGGCATIMILPAILILYHLLS